MLPPALPRQQDLVTHRLLLRAVPAKDAPTGQAHLARWAEPAEAAALRLEIKEEGLVLAP